jgi:hypothetical protein
LITVGFLVLVLGFLAQQNKRLEREIHRLHRAVRKRDSEGCGPRDSDH